jgi:hypothetical protein
MVKKKVKQFTKPKTKKKKIASKFRPAYEYYDMRTGEIYPKIFFRETFWTKLLKFLGIKQ